jgi:hypothetical protein
LLALGCFSWGVADFLWAAFYFSGVNPESSKLINIIYLLTNTFIFLSLLALTKKKTQDWSMAQFYLDLIITSLLTCVFIYVVFFKKDISKLNSLLKFDITASSALYRTYFALLCLPHGLYQSGPESCRCSLRSWHLV